MSEGMTAAVSGASATLQARSFIGQSIPRKEDDRLVKGQGVFTDDIRRHGMGYVHFVRSPFAHARIASIDLTAALALPGVYGTLTGDEVTLLTEPFFQIAAPPGGNLRDYALAVGKVRYLGEPVVAVVADTRERAQDAAELVMIDYEPLPVNVDAHTALEPDTAVLHEAAGGNLTYSGVWEWGDVESAFDEADAVIDIDELHFHRFNSTPLECHAALVEYDAGTGEWTIHTNHHFPGFALLIMTPALRTTQSRLRFVSKDIGGGFGNKMTSHPQLVACCLLARKLGRPVQWTEGRTDFHQSMAHGNERWFQGLEVAVKSDGTLLGMRCHVLDDVGAWLRYEPVGAVAWSHVVPGLYRWRNMRIEWTQVVTNKAPCSPNRGFSRMQHLWLCERVIDIVATVLRLDPVEVRQRNYIRADEMPYETPNGCVYDSGDYERMLELALGLIDYPTIDERRADAAARGRILGFGIGSSVDSGTNNLAQSRLLNPSLRFSGNNEAAAIKLDMSGEVVVTLGTAPQGQGHETTAAQVVAGILGCEPDDVLVRVGHDSHWNAHAGFSGTYASQFAVTGLGAVKGAAEILGAQIRKLAGMLLGCPEDEIELVGSSARRQDDPDATLSFAALGALDTVGNAGLPDDRPTLNARYTYRPPFEIPDGERKFGNLALTYAAQVHACVLEIDPETGCYEIVDYVAVDDCGTRIHPQIVEGQVHGALAHGIGAAIWETFAYDADGNLLTPNFYDYHVPHMLDMPPLRTSSIESPSPFGPLGAKGMGEGGGGAIHCICSALQDALRSVGRGIVADSHNPSHRVWELLHGTDLPQARATSRRPA
jgi:2-furoyl-CoA dehydrogenase large subunit